MQALFFLRKEKRWLVEKMVKEEYYEKESIIVKLMVGIHIFILIHWETKDDICEISCNT